MHHQDTQPASVPLYSLATRYVQGFLKDEILQFISIPAMSHAVAKLNLTCAGGQILWKKAEPNHH